MPTSDATPYSKAFPDLGKNALFPHLDHVLIHLSARMILLYKASVNTAMLQHNC